MTPTTRRKVTVWILICCSFQVAIALREELMGLRLFTEYQLKLKNVHWSTNFISNLIHQHSKCFSQIFWASAYSQVIDNYCYRFFTKRKELLKVSVNKSKTAKQFNCISLVSHSAWTYFCQQGWVRSHTEKTLPKIHRKINSEFMSQGYSQCR